MPKVLIVEPDSDGHHAFWLVLLIHAHQRAGWQVEVLGDPDNEALREQAALRGLAWESVRWHQAGERRAGGPALVSQSTLLAETITADRLFFAFLDNLWDGILAMPASTRRRLAGKVAGIWFHPHALDAGWRWAPPLGKRWRLRGALHRFVRSGDAANLFECLLFLSTEAAGNLARLNPRPPAHVVPDPYEREPGLTRAEARARFGLPAGRTIFLHLGSSEPRKGLPDTLRAFEMLGGRDAEGLANPPLLLRVGKNDRLQPAERARLERLVGAGRARLVESFVPGGELMEYFAACDWVLVPYRKFRYSSGILANAAGALRPVIASDHGQIGDDVARQGLGLLFRHGSPRALAKTLADVLRDPGARAEAFNERLKSARRSRTVDAMLAALETALARPAA